jgi:hypothetical protein
MGLSHAMCPYCGDAEETIIHVLRYCPLAKDIWLTLIPLKHKREFFMSELDNWMHFNLTNSIVWNCRVDWKDYWVVACHALWSWRNKELHDDDFVRPYRPAYHIMQLALDYTNAESNSKVATCSNSVVAVIGWSPPKENYVKLNTDCAYKKNQITGCSGIIRGSQGECWVMLCFCG